MAIIYLESILVYPYCDTYNNKVKLAMFVLGKVNGIICLLLFPRLKTHLNGNYVEVCAGLWYNSGYRALLGIIYKGIVRLRVDKIVKIVLDIIIVYGILMYR